MIDMHTHFVPHDFPPYSGRCANHQWPEMHPHQSSCHRAVVISSQTFRIVEEPCWSTDRRLADMDSMQVQRQVLSPMPELLSYWMDPRDTHALACFLNDVAGEMVNRDPTRFSGLGAVALQDPDLALAGLHHACVDVGLAGVEIGSNVNGLPIGDPSFEPFFAEAARIGAAVFVHALRPTGVERLVGPPLLEGIVANPSEMAFAVASVITSGLMDRHPNLRLAFSHGGGGFALTLPRLRHAWRTFSTLSENIATDPLETARAFFYDGLVYDPKTLRFLMDVFGATQIMVGTDYPFAFGDHTPAASLIAADLSKEDHRLMSTANAARFLDIE